MFNVFFPKLLEIGPGKDGAVEMTAAKTLEENLWDVMIFTIGGTPGAIVCSSILVILVYLIDLPLTNSLELGSSNPHLADACHWLQARLLPPRFAWCLLWWSRRGP